jgi:tetratricopeptide (TPR) repeat protein
MSRVAKFAAAAVLSVTLSGFVCADANAAVTVFGGDFAQACYTAAKNDLARDENVLDCSRAIETEQLMGHDLAGTYVNRGALYMSQGRWGAAEQDFAEALRIEPKLAEALVNMGAAEIGMHRNRDGVDAITQGLALGSSEPEKAYYNRALGYEALGDVASAYNDYLKAAALKPAWTAPREELVRFHTQPAGGGASPGG